MLRTGLCSSVDNEKVFLMADCRITERTQQIGRKPSRIVTYADEYTTIEINETWCKGCELCVEFCPTETLAMKGVKAAVVKLFSRYRMPTSFP